jgi:hypothetical protein
VRPERGKGQDVDVEAILMRKVRFSIAGLMVAVAVSALVSAGLRSANAAAFAGAMLMLTSGVLGLAIVGVVSRRGNERTWWLGFTLFGCGYLVLAFWTENGFHSLPTTSLLLFLSSNIDPSIPQNVWSRAGSPYWTYLQIAHCFWALVAASLGGALAYVLFPASEHQRAQTIAETYPDRPLPRIWRRRPAVIWLTGLAIVLLAALAGSRSAPGLWAGVIFLLTCGMLALAILGASFGRGSRRAMWLGAALFGCTYMVLTFGRSWNSEWPYPPTTHLLNALRPGSPPHVTGFPDASERNNVRSASILRLLEQPIPMHFPNWTPLEDILKHVVAETKARDPNGRGIPIYVDPVGLNSAQKVMTSKVQIDVEGVALKNSLRRCLKQLDLAFAVRDGFLMITANGQALPAYEDPFLIVGHCLLALIAAGLGGVLAPLVSDARARTMTSSIDPSGPA